MDNEDKIFNELLLEKRHNSMMRQLAEVGSKLDFTELIKLINEYKKEFISAITQHDNNFQQRDKQFIDELKTAIANMPTKLNAEEDKHEDEWIFIVNRNERSGLIESVNAKKI